MRIAFPTLALALISCAAAPADFTGVSQSPIIWPPGDPEPRIEFLFAYRDSEDVVTREGFLSRLGGFVFGHSQNRIVSPYGLDRTSDGRLIIADTALGAIHSLDLETGEHQVIHGTRSAPLISPIGVAVAQDDRIYVTDSSTGRIHLFSSEGKHMGFFGSPEETGRPTGIVFDRDRDRLLIVDTTGCRLLSYDPGGQLLDVVGGRGEEPGSFNYPTNLTIARDGRILVMDTLNFRVQTFSPEFEYLGQFGFAGSGRGTFAKPKGIAVDSEGHVYVVDGMFDNIQVFDASGQLLLAFCSGGTTYGHLTLPTGILIDDEDRIFVADSGNARIQVFQYHSRVQ